MEVTLSKNKILDILRALAFGFGSGIVCFFLTLNGGISISLGLLIAYMEVRFKQFQK